MTTSLDNALYNANGVKALGRVKLWSFSSWLEVDEALRVLEHSK